ncbi:MAG: polysaccharide deacetylase family protein [Thermodesulfobacteriota bacterium]
MADPDSKGNTFIFLDTGGKRWNRLRLVALSASLLLFVAAVLFVQSLLSTPRLEQPQSLRALQSRLQLLQTKETRQPAPSKPVWLKRAGQKGGKAGLPAQHGGMGEIRLGFYAAWDPASLVSLGKHGNQLTHLSPKWLTMADGEGTLRAFPLDEKLLEMAAEAGLTLMPRLDNLSMDTWLPEAVEAVAYGPPERRQRLIGELLTRLAEIEAGGIILDWGQLDPTYRPRYTALVQEIANALHQEGMALWLGVPVGDELRAFDLEALAPVVDNFVAMLHDENSEYDQPGPIASQPWFDEWLRAVTSYGQPHQWIVSIGTYGYDWREGGEKAELIAFADAMARAGKAKVEGCGVAGPLFNPSFSYTENGRRHSVWFLDGVTFANQLQAARRLNLGGVAVFQLGTEDPAVWTALEMAAPSAANPPDALQAIPVQGPIANVGQGDFLRLEEAGEDGVRRVSVAGETLVSIYQRFPAYQTIVHYGLAAGDQVAITFDDGPDPDWTPDVLDVLREKGVKATFFMVGGKMEDHPELVRRVVAEGHEVGIHTYAHPNIAEVSEERALIELNATQRLLEKITGRSTLLFRPPYNADSRPADDGGIIPIRVAQGLGYLTVGHSLDPQDWQKPGVDQLVNRVREGRQFGQTILLHDAGGNRRQTVEALPRIIDYLRTRGDRIVPLAEMVGLAPAALMPEPPPEPPLSRIASAGGFELLHRVQNFLWSFMIVATILVAIRTLVVIWLARRQKRRVVPAGFAPAVSVLLPAYNEEKVIASTLGALLRSDHAGELEILVVDDGSTDQTAQAVTTLAQTDPRVRLLRQANQGKAVALRAALAAASHEIVVLLDADTQFQPDTIRHLVAPLADAKVAAVSGHAKVGNQATFIARCQDLEYTCGFNLDRRAFDDLDCITVAPGAVSAFRRSAIAEAGGISTDTLAEDTDLTLTLHRLGYRIAYASEAIAWTEAPERFGVLAKQRFRWAFGTLQCLWKHRDLLFNLEKKALGWFSLPGLWFFQIVLVAVAPLVDSFLVASLFLGGGIRIAIYITIFLGLDLLLAAMACALEPQPLKAAWRIVPMRFIYRPLLSFVIWKSLIKAGKGVWVGWGKQERTGSVTLPA